MHSRRLRNSGSLTARLKVEIGFIFIGESQQRRMELSSLVHTIVIFLPSMSEMDRHSGTISSMRLCLVCQLWREETFMLNGVSHYFFLSICSCSMALHSC